ncbi:hypothetical protein BJY14_003127 [Actinomadura luteofluorescens]|uniref:Uncharacterized protein n=1 Tax=Actinomadura luteofluorescens TaxID=46163 RepID=A0A7Y9EG90_9ACTN|nr:hypothetical protein [Actinomadura luteofluorescens]NYD47144.1 hypothetical protein [Actinomadura luteofluorescens]
MRETGENPITPFGVRHGVEETVLLQSPPSRREQHPVERGAEQIGDGGGLDRHQLVVGRQRLHDGRRRTLEDRSGDVRRRGREQPERTDHGRDDPRLGTPGVSGEPTRGAAGVTDHPPVEVTEAAIEPLRRFVTPYSSKVHFRDLPFVRDGCALPSNAQGRRLWK